MIDFKLWKHQKDGVEKAIAGDSFAFLWDPGVGKTLATIQVLRHRYAEAGGIVPTLILAPVIVLENWAAEFEKFSRIPQRNIAALVGPTKKRIDKLNSLRQRTQGRCIVITNYESLVSNKTFFQVLMGWAPRILVVDESQRIKNHQSQRTKKVIKLADSARYRYLLTGTPILNSPMDIFSQYRALDGGASFGKNFMTFRAKYFYDANAWMPKESHFPDWRIRPESYEKMNKIIYSKATRAIKEECLDLPPLLLQKVILPLPDKVRKVYDSMMRDFLAVLEDTVITADMAITKSLKLLQIVNGFIKDEDGKIRALETAKISALEELLGDICTHSKVLVWCCFKENYNQVRQVCQKLKLKYVEAHGSISHSAKYRAVEEFNDNPHVKVFIGHPGSLGVGINLVAASYAIYFSRTFNLEHDIQSQARNYRGGSECHKKITRIDLIAKDTIDELAMEALSKKMNSANKILALCRKKLLT